MAQKPKSNRAGEISTRLKSDIESGRLAPGTWLDERALAERFDVSRTPVREALQQLAAQDLVRIAPRQGICVSRLSISDLRCRLELLGELEALVARLAARRMDRAQQQLLESALAECEAAASTHDSEAFVAGNVEFHHALYGGCGNNYLVRQALAIHRSIHRYRINDFRTPAQIAKSQADHRAIAAAVLAGDEAGAQRAMFAHVPMGSSGFSEFLSTVPPGFFEADTDGTIETGPAVFG